MPTSLLTNLKLAKVIVMQGEQGKLDVDQQCREDVGGGGADMLCWQHWSQTATVHWSQTMTMYQKRLLWQ